jgi:hypothetical protein
MSERNLSDGDVAAIVDALEVRLTDKFYRDLGKGLWGLVWKVLIGALLFVASYGALKYGGKS